MSSHRGDEEVPPTRATPSTGANPATPPPGRPDGTPPPAAGDHRSRNVPVEPDRATVVAREREALGGVKVGSAFFGWLAATGMAVLLTALAAAGGAAVAVATGNDASSITDDTETVGLASAIVLLVVLFIAYYCGGYVAGRMARFDGIKQGIAVWVWAVVIAIIVAVVAAVAGDEYDVLSRLDAFPRIPVNEGDVTTAGIIAGLAIAVVTLVGAALGGLAGMRFHRKVDRAGLGR